MNDLQIKKGIELKDEIERLQKFIKPLDPKNKGNLGYTKECKIKIFGNTFKLWSCPNRKWESVEIEVPEDFVKEIATLAKKRLTQLRKEYKDL